MNNQNTARLYITFPSFFMMHLEGDDLDARLANEYDSKFAKIPDREGRYPRHPYGFECGDGWYKLLFQLCENLTHLASIYNLAPYVGQVKEKYGLLRFHLYFPQDVNAAEQEGDFGSSAVITRKSGIELASWLVEEAERQSEITCMTCGKAGVMRRTGWHHVACDACYAEEVVTF